MESRNNNPKYGDLVGIESGRMDVLRKNPRPLTQNDETGRDKIRRPRDTTLRGTPWMKDESLRGRSLDLRNRRGDIHKIPDRKRPWETGVVSRTRTTDVWCSGWMLRFRSDSGKDGTKGIDSVRRVRRLPSSEREPGFPDSR